MLRNTLFVFSLSFTLWSQTPEQAVVDFFTAFHQRDSLVLADFFTSKAQLQTLLERPEQPTKVSEVPVNRFIQAVSKRPQTPVWEERLGTPTVLQHQGLAQVWVPYRFLLDGKTSHCGYNSFQLVLLDGVWKINHLIDTRTKACQDPVFP